MAQNFRPPPPAIVVINGAKQFRCPHPGCGRVLKKMWNYQSHSKTHSDYRPYKCGRCNQEFKWESSFKAHIASKSHKENGSSRGGGSGGSSTLGFAPGRGGSSRGDSSRGSGSSPPGPLPPFHTLSGSGRGWPSGSGARSGGRGPLPPVSSLLPENPSGSSPMRRSSGTR